MVIFGGLLATFFYNLCAAALRSVGDTRSALLALLAAMAANLALDLLFVARLGMGIAGAAWATVLAQLLSVALCLLYLARRYPQLLFRREDRRAGPGPAPPDGELWGGVRPAPVQPLHRQAAGPGGGELHGDPHDLRLHRHYPHRGLR